jgi:hypothetical protein
MPLPDSRKSAGEGLVGSPEYWPLKTNQAARQAFVESIIGDEDKYIDEAANMMWDAIDAFVAMLIYAKEIANRSDCDAFDDRRYFRLSRLPDSQQPICARNGPAGSEATLEPAE